MRFLPQYISDFLKRFFITSNLLAAEDQICVKVLVANEKSD